MRRWFMQHEFGSGSQHRKEFINKVAEKLGVPPDKVAAALQEARKERVDQSVIQRIQQAVQNGFITQAEADQIRKWWGNRPDAIKKLWLGHMHGGRSGKCGTEAPQK
jgi:hypothetical protein